MRTKHLIPNNAAGLTYAARDYSAGEDHGGGDGVGGDPFEGFPDAVLGLIVSKLPLRSAVAASAISRRWRGAVAAAPALDLDFAAAFPAAPRRRAAFAAAVTAALGSSAPPHRHPLRRLRLALEGFFDQAFAASAADHLASWLTAAAARGVERLELHLPRSRLAVLPPSLLACTSLTSLTLRLDRYALPLPSFTTFTRLSRLHIACVSLNAEDDFFGDLFLHCKEVRYLILEKCRVGALRLTGPSRLCSLAITDCSWTEESALAVFEMPELRILHYSGAIAARHIIDGEVSLEDVLLNIEKPLVKPREAALRELLTLVGNARRLALSPWCIEQFARPEEWSKLQLDKVRWLTCIVERREEGALSIVPLLSNCRNVEELCVSVVPSQGKWRRNSGDGGSHGVLGGKRVSVKHLKVVRMKYIDESRSGFKLVKVLLKNASALETMTIVPSMDGLEQAKFRRRVLKLRKSSQNASVQFCTAG
ncbi:F-box domain containing protein [Zea mays]|uniref:FBD domain-containing protein n=1 Tax=Zea mays TaxID=4577 RepID=A0A804NUR1_MAIZE|nr:F-box domain containing protein [Zea mays]|eukprot:NP_001151131.2 F-box domain containing protein [Zea mays]